MLFEAKQNKNKKNKNKTKNLINRNKVSVVVVGELRSVLGNVMNFAATS